MRHFLILGSALLAACSHTQPGVEIREVRVEVPVAVACVKADQIPAAVPPVGALPSNAVNAADILAAAVLELRATDRELRALLSGCIR